MNNFVKSPPQPPSLSQFNTYTTWPGGVDPTAPVFNTDNQKFGGKRKSKKNTRKNRKDRKNRKNMRKTMNRK
jgi:hypothetical protein